MGRGICCRIRCDTLQLPPCFVFYALFLLFAHLFVWVCFIGVREVARVRGRYEGMKK